jgi:hypothetical protein
MSLQTPRGLTDRDIGLLRTAVASGSDMDVRALLSGQWIHLNAHEPDVVPCLCRACIQPDVERVEAEGETYLREWAVAKGRVLFFWMPEALAKDKKSVRRAVEARMHAKLR